MALHSLEKESDYPIVENLVLFFYSTHLHFFLKLSISSWEILINSSLSMKPSTNSKAFWHYKPPCIIGPGLTQLNVSLPLTATIYPNSSILPEGKGNWVQFPLGTLWLEAELYDLQAQTTSITEIPALIFIKITVN
jgi:hypothetical protein